MLSMTRELYSSNGPTRDGRTSDRSFAHFPMIHGIENAYDMGFLGKEHREKSIILSRPARLLGEKNPMKLEIGREGGWSPF